MAKVKDYENDENISLNDKLLGTDGDDANKTKNFSIGALSAFFGSGGGATAGDSAYEVAVSNGFEGTEAEWLESLIGADGDSAYDIAVSNGFEGSEVEWLASLQGGGGTKTSGSTTLTTTPTQLAYDFNFCSFATGIAYLPTTTEVGKEVVVMALSNNITINANVGATSAMFEKPGSLFIGKVMAQYQMFRFTFVGSGLWKAEDMGKDHKVIDFDLTIDGGIPSATYRKNEFLGQALNLSIPSNGKLRIHSPDNIFTPNKTKVQPIVFDNGGQMYFGVPIYNLLPSYLDINLRLFDNTQTSTPSVANLRILIQVFY